MDPQKRQTGLKGLLKSLEYAKILNNQILCFVNIFGISGKY